MASEFILSSLRLCVLAALRYIVLKPRVRLDSSDSHIGNGAPRAGR